MNTLLCGGIAGCATWASIYPLDVVKTLVQVQASLTAAPVPLGAVYARPALGAWACAKKAYLEGGVPAFWGGIWVCLGRAFIVRSASPHDSILAHTDNDFGICRSMR